ncbi:MAG: SBBP repeat-containing protein [Bryobacteraceae bacterium]
MIRLTLSFCLFSGLVCAATAPSFPVLAYSTYLRDGFTPKAIAADSAGNIYLAGNAVLDPQSPQTTVLVMKLNPQGTQYLYVRYLGGSVNDSANAIAVDSAGNAYVAGSTRSPDFPVTAGGNLGTAPTGQSDQRSFVTKLDGSGNVVFSDLLGGSAMSAAQAVAVNAARQVIVSGASSTTGFPTTVGAYSVATSANHPYLLELDPTGMKALFSATGIGGSAIALDTAGNIYVGGTTYLLNYPTTPGVYQPTFPAFSYCSSPFCLGGNQGANQYVTKVDPTGSKLIFSTSLSGSAQTTNAGLAVDAAGDVYVTGYAGASYPFTVTVPSSQINIPFLVNALPFLSKLDPTGQTLLFSVPVGGAGVETDASGDVYVAGDVGFPSTIFAVPANVPALANVPAPCLPVVGGQGPGASQFIHSSLYAAQVDAATGNVRGTQWIGGSSLTASGVALAGSELWIAGATTLPDFAFTSGALIGSNLSPVPTAGAYLGAVDFSQPQPPAGTPQIGCIVDSASLAPVGLATRYQLLTIFGTGLGPATGVGAGEMTNSLGGATVSFTGNGTYNAPLLYVSSSQINFAVPLLGSDQSVGTMTVNVNGQSSAALGIPLTYANPSVFLTQPASGNSLGFQAMALNADGSTNSATNPAPLGSTISVFVNGLSSYLQATYGSAPIAGGLGWTVTGIVPATTFVLQVNMQAPTTLVNDFACSGSVCEAAFTLNLLTGGGFGNQLSGVSGEAFGGLAYVKRN